MAKTYDIKLKGRVGGPDFNLDQVDRMLAHNRGKQVDVLIDSTGGSLATALSISASFRQHGEVNVHFVGMNASAATIAALGAKHVSIDKSAMYLVHKCSMTFFEWGSLNSDQYAQLIADCTKVKDDLDKLDQNVAQCYAARCKRTPDDLLSLMKTGAWLSADEALAWGFVDEITDSAADKAPKLTRALASAMVDGGIPLPNVDFEEALEEGFLSKIIGVISAILGAAPENKKTIIPVNMEKEYKFVADILGQPTCTLTDDTASFSAEDLDKIENHFADLGKKIADNDAALAAKDATIDELNTKIADLEAKLAAAPADTTGNVVDDTKGNPAAEENDVEAYVRRYNAAKKFYSTI